MCTVSWLFTHDGYDLLVNRDEMRSRLRAEAPRRFSNYLAPVDTDAGGTWVAVNDQGLAVCLLNRYPSGTGFFTSRGLLVRDLASANSVDEAVERLGSIQHNRKHAGLPYHPFTLLVLAPGREAAVLLWDGELLAQAEPPTVPVLTSSSREALAVGPVRRRLWSETVGPTPDFDAALAFHRSHTPERGVRSPCMHRDDARTVSLTHVRVTATSAAMSYADGPPCRTDLGQALSLIRRNTHKASTQHAVPVG